jgi:predicted ATPase
MAAARRVVDDRFARETRDALAHLYDPSQLEVHPLAEPFGGGKALRRALEEAIDELRPRRDDRPDPHALRRHELLRLRYLDGMPVEDVQRRLTIGRSEYYREHQQAVAAVASLLRKRARSDRAPIGAEPESPSPLDAPAAPPTLTRLPIPTTSFVGRESDLAEVVRLLGTTRLLTLTGAGGCGKTRLALHAAAELRAGFPDGLYLVELAPLADPALVVGAVASVLGLRDAPGQPMLDRLLRFVGDKRLLLVLDNCEHLVDACARLADAVLRGTPAAHVLATSRELLRVGGEVSWRVPSLPSPATDAVSARSVDDYPAVRLFADRAAAVVPAFRLTDDNAPAVVRICQRLDGMPLALELAAARVRVLTVEEIAGRLDDRFRLLTGGDRTALPRQRTLRALVDWSYELLSTDEQVLFRRLAVFAGGWTLASAEAVCADDDLGAEAILDALTSLVDRSLAFADGRGREERYRFPETVREYALERLADSSDAEPVRERHAAHMAAVAEDVEPDLTGPRAPAGLDRLELELENLRAAMHWCGHRGDAETGLRCVSALLHFWMYRGDRGEGSAWLIRFLALPSAEPPSPTRARALVVAAVLAANREEYDRAQVLAEEGLSISRELDDKKTEGEAMVQLGYSTWRRGDHAMARQLLERALPGLRQGGPRWRVVQTLTFIALVATAERQMILARPLLMEALTIAREIGYYWGIGASLSTLGQLSLEADDVEAAQASFAASLEAYHRLGDRGGIANASLDLAKAAARRGDVGAARGLLAGSLPLHLQLGETIFVAASLALLAYLAAVEGSSRRAHTLLGSAQAIRQRIGARPDPLLQIWSQGWPEETGRQMGEPARAAADAAGRAMTVEQAVAYALTDEVHPSNAKQKATPAVV